MNEENTVSDTEDEEKKAGDDVKDSSRKGSERLKIPCSFNDNCKFWKMDSCRYKHPDKYDAKADNKKKKDDKENNDSRKETRDADEDEGENGKGKDEKTNKGRMCKYGKRCRDVNTDKCTFNHKCSRRGCDQQKCRYNHEENKQHDDKKPERKDECRFRRNCKNNAKGLCEYFHPPTEKKITESDPKNWQKEMYESVHFLTQQMKEMEKQIREMKVNQGERK